MGYKVTPIEGLQISNRRGLAFIELDADEELDAKKVFEALSVKLKRDVMARFDYWLSGQTFPKYHHGWREDANRHCYVFKWNRAGTGHRMYGFLINPKEIADPAFQACVLTHHSQKNEQQTEPWNLKLANKVRGLPAARAAVKKAYPDVK